MKRPKRGSGPTSTLGRFSMRTAGSVALPGLVEIGKRARLEVLHIRDGYSHETPEDLRAAIERGQHVDFLGETASGKILTLLRCLHTSQRSITVASTGATSSAISFQPQEIWEGSTAFDADDLADELRMRFSGIHSIIGSKPLGRKIITDNLDKQKAAELIGSEIWEIFFSDESKVGCKVSIDDAGIDISFRSHFSRSFSNTDGDRIITFDECIISATPRRSIKDLCSYGRRVEQFLSFICLRDIRSDGISINKYIDGGPIPLHYQRLWQLAGRKKRKARVMPHQALTSISEESDEDFKHALRIWITADGDLELARWLYLDNQQNRSVSTGRLIAIMQAVEIVGREASMHPPYNPKNFKNAAEKAASLICDELGNDYRSEEWRLRFRNLILAGNRSSFRDNLQNFIEGLPISVRSIFLPDREEFVRRVVRLRNAFVHPDHKTMILSDAQRSVGEATYRLLTLFAAHQGVSLGLNAEQIVSGLANSPIGMPALHFLRKSK